MAPTGSGNKPPKGKSTPVPASAPKGGMIASFFNRVGSSAQPSPCEPVAPPTEVKESIPVPETSATVEPVVVAEVDLTQSPVVQVQVKKNLCALFSKAKEPKEVKEVKPTASTPSNDIVELDAAEPAPVVTPEVAPTPAPVPAPKAKKHKQPEPQEVINLEDDDEPEEQEAELEEEEAPERRRRSARIRSKPQYAYFAGERPDEPEEANYSSEEEPKPKKALKKAALFLTKAEKKAIEAEAREARIQESILKTKLENDQMLAAVNKGETASLFLKPVRKEASASGAGAGAGTSSKGEDVEASMEAIHVGYSTDYLQMVENIATTCLLKDRTTAIPIASVQSTGCLIAWQGAAQYLSPSSAFDLKDLWFKYANSVGTYSSEVAVSPTSLYAEKKAELVTWLKEWIAIRHTEPKKTKRRADSDLDDSDSEVDGVCSLFVLHGPTGSGKTSLVYEAARAAAAEVIEVNTSSVRSSAVIKRMLSEVAESHRMAHGKGEESNTCSVVLFDEGDVVFEEEDLHFHSAIARLASTARCPIILTVESPPAFLSTMKAAYHYLSLAPPSLSDAVSLLPGNAASKVLLAMAADPRAARQMAALVDPVPHPLPLLGDWLVDKVDFGLFDAITSCQSGLIAEDVGWKAFTPIVTSAHPHQACAGQLMTISGRHFLQSSTTIASAAATIRSCTYHGTYLLSLPCRVLSDEELSFVLPVVPDGIFTVSITITFAQPKLAISSTKCACFCVGKMDTKSLSYAQHRLSLMPSDNSVRKKSKRVGYASSATCKGKLQLERKRFSKSKKQGGEEEDGEEEGGDLEEEWDAPVRRSSRKRNLREESDSEEEDEADEEDGQEVRDDGDGPSDDQQVANGAVSVVEAATEPSAMMDQDSPSDSVLIPAYTAEEDAAHVATLLASMPAVQAERASCMPCLAVPVGTREELAADLEALTSRCYLLDLLSDGDGWGSAFDLDGDVDVCQEVERAVAVLRNREQYGEYCQSIYMLQQGWSEKSSSSGKVDTLDGVQSAESAPSTQSTLVDLTPTACNDKQLLSHLHSPYLRYFSLRNSARRALLSAWTTVTGVRCPVLSTFASTELFPYTAVLARLSLQEDEYLWQLAREQAASSKRRRLSNRAMEDEREVKYSYLTERLALEEATVQGIVDLYVSEI